MVKGFSSAVLRDAGWRGGGKSHNETWYLSQLYASIGIRASEAAQQLLGKAKSLKSVGGLEKFVRDYMLDEPESIKDIASALAQIDPLVSARDNLEVARSKYSTLDGIDDAYGTFVEESTRLASVTMIDKPMVFDFVDHLRKDKCGPEIARLDRELSEIGADCTGLEERKQAAYTHLSVLIGRVSAASNNLAPVEFALQQARVRAEDVQRNADGYELLIREIGYPLADNETDFAELRQICWEQVAAIDTQIKSGDSLLHSAIQKFANAKDRVVELEQEAARIRELGSPIPADESAMRARIVAALRLTAKHMPYVAELMEIRDDRQRWQVAAEKVLRRAGLTLLVPRRYYRDVLEFVHANNMHGYLKLQEAAPGARIVEPRAATLSAVLRLTEPDHECAAAAQLVVADAGDFVCVDGPAQLDRHTRAVTDSGLLKTGVGRAIKDDRKPMRASAFLFQGDLEAKLEALASDIAEAHADQQLAAIEVQAMESDRDQLRRQKAAVSAVYENYPSFSVIDRATADRDVDDLEQQLQALLDENPDLEKLKQQQEEQQRIYDRIGNDIALQRHREGELDRQRTALLELEERLLPGPVSERVRDVLIDYTAEMVSTLNLLQPQQFSGELWRIVSAEQVTLQENAKRSRGRVEKIMSVFDDRFRDAIPNDSDDIDAKAADYVDLWRRIKEREIPDAYNQMHKLITRDAPSALLNLRTKADNAAALIHAQIDRVNTGLSAVEFNTGSRLRLKAPDRNLSAVRELNDRCTRIAQRAAQVAAEDKEAIHEQYKDILELRQLLGSSEPEHRQWTRDALDVRYRFAMYCEEFDANDVTRVLRTHSNSEDNSGGEQEKLMAFCLAGALSYNLADPDSGDNRPVFAQLMLDEAFSKSDPVFARQALAAFGRFGFQLIIVATLQNSTVIEPHVGGVVLVSKPDKPGVRPVAAVRAQTIDEFVPFRRSLSRQTASEPAAL